MKLNLRSPDTQWTLIRAVADPDRGSSPLEPVDAVLSVLEELEGLPASPGKIGGIVRGTVNVPRLTAAWITGEPGAELIALRGSDKETEADAYSTRVAVRGVWLTRRDWGRSDGIRAQDQIKVALERGNELPEDFELDGGAQAALLVRPPGRVLILPLGASHSEVVAIRDRIGVVSRLLELANVAGVAESRSLNSVVVGEARRRGMSVDALLITYRPPAALALEIADRCGDEAVRTALGLKESTLRRLRRRQR